MKKKKENKLEIGNSLVFEQARELKEKFDRLIESEPVLRVSSGIIKSMDLTGIQLIQYFIFRAKILGKELIFSMKIEEEAKRMLLKNGFSQIVETVFA